MANYSNLKAAIAAAIKQNGNQEITGQVLQDVLTSMVSVIGANYTFAGVATPATNPGTPDQNVFYLAMEGGTYTNFNGTVLPAGISLLMWNGAWASNTVMYGDGGVFDISVYKSSGGTLAKFADLAAALDGGNNIPASAKKGGMSVKFVQSSDNKYVQYMLAAPNWSTDIHDWTYEDPYFIDKIMQEVNEAIDENTPIEIHGDVSNAPDEEDLTSVNIGGTDVLKFKDKAYNSLTYSGMGRKILRKNIVEGVNTLTQEMMSDANTIYVIQYDFDLGGDEVTIPEGCILEFDGGSLSNGSLVLQNTLFDGMVRLGADMEFSGICKNAEFNQEWFNNNDVDSFFKFINNVTTEGSSCIYNFKPGIYYPTVGINIETSKNVIIKGNNSSLIYNLDSLSSFSSKIAIYIGALQKDKTKYYLRSDTGKGFGRIELETVEGIVLGEHYTIMDRAAGSYNWSRDYYMQGEIFKAKEFSSNTDNAVVPDNYLFGVYKYRGDESSYMIKTDFINVKIEDLTIKTDTDYDANNETFGMYLEHCKSTLSNVTAKGFTTSIALYSNLDSKVSGCIAHGTHNYSDTTSGYGLMIAQSQNVEVDGGDYRGVNHGIAVGCNGGSYNIVNRFINIHDTNSYSYKFRWGIDNHGCTEYTSIVNNHTNGIKIGCNHSTVIGNTIEGTAAGGISQNELIGLDFIISNNITNSIQLTFDDSNGNYQNTAKTEGTFASITNNHISGTFILDVIQHEINQSHLEEAHLYIANNLLGDIIRSTMKLIDTNDLVIQNSPYRISFESNKIINTHQYEIIAPRIDFVGNDIGTGIRFSCAKLFVDNNRSINNSGVLGSFVFEFYPNDNPTYTLTEGHIANNYTENNFIVLTRIPITVPYKLYCKNNTVRNDARFLGLNRATGQEAYTIYWDDNDVVDGRMSSDSVVPIKASVSRRYRTDESSHSYNYTYPVYLNELGVILYKDRTLNNKYAYKNSIGDKIPFADVEGVTLQKQCDCFKIPYKILSGNYLHCVLCISQNSEYAIICINSFGGSAHATVLTANLFGFGISFQRDSTNGYFYIKLNDASEYSSAKIIITNTILKDDEFCTSVNSSQVGGTFYNVDVKNVDGTTVGVKRSGLFNERPLVADIYEGYEFYATDLKEALTYIEDTRTGDNISGGVSGGSVYAMANNLISGRLYDIKTTRSYTKCYFSKVSENPTEEDLLPAVDGNTWTAVTAPDPLVYPYIYIDNTGGGSITVVYVRGYRTWLQYDSAVAGVLRSGNTASRPIGYQIYVGFMYFDTTLGKPIYASAISGDTVTWVDATGTTI